MRGAPSGLALGLALLAGAAVGLAVHLGDGAAAAGARGAAARLAIHLDDGAAAAGAARAAAGSTGGAASTGSMAATGPAESDRRGGPALLALSADALLASASTRAGGAGPSSGQGGPVAGDHEPTAGDHGPTAGARGPAAGDHGPAAGAEAPDGDGPAYDGRFTFLRVRFGDDGSGLRGGFFGGGRGRGREPPWAHDTPRAERNFAKILEATTTLQPYMDGGRVLDLDDPDLFRYPVAYIVEVGYWNPSDAEARRLGEYLLKGGFLIVDDFRGRDIYRFIDAMKRVLPGSEVLEVPDDHEIFDSFFHIEEPRSILPPPTFRQYNPMYLGIFEDGDPSKRLMAVLNYNNDHAEYWEYSDFGYYPIDLSNEAYKFGVNYVVYAMTH